MMSQFHDTHLTNSLFSLFHKSMNLSHAAKVKFSQSRPAPIGADSSFASTIGLSDDSFTNVINGKAIALLVHGHALTHTSHRDPL